MQSFHPARIQYSIVLNPVYNDAHLAIMKYLIPVILLNLSFFSAYGKDSDWALVQDSQGIRIYQQPSSSGHAITRGMMNMDTSIDAVLSVMRDNKACARWLFACRSNQTIHTESDNERLDYTVIDSPFVYSDRDMYVYSTGDYNKVTQTFTIRSSGRENYDKGQPNRVRIKSIQVFWRLKKISLNKISVLYQVSSDPQLVKSSFLDNHVAKSVFITLRNLEIVSQQAPYKYTKLPELQ